MTKEINREETLNKKKFPIMDLAGAWKDIDTDKLIKELYKERKIGSRRFK